MAVHIPYCKESRRPCRITFREEISLVFMRVTVKMFRSSWSASFFRIYCVNYFITVTVQSKRKLLRVQPNMSIGSLAAARQSFILKRSSPRSWIFIIASLPKMHQTFECRCISNVSTSERDSYAYDEVSFLLLIAEAVAVVTGR